MNFEQRLVVYSIHTKSLHWKVFSDSVSLSMNGQGALHHKRCCTRTKVAIILLFIEQIERAFVMHKAGPIFDTVLTPGNDLVKLCS